MQLCKVKSIDKYQFTCSTQIDSAPVNSKSDNEFACGGVMSSAHVMKRLTQTGDIRSTNLYRE
jgi:hypothetical protein